MKRATNLTPVKMIGFDKKMRLIKGNIYFKYWRSTRLIAVRSCAYLFTSVYPFILRTWYKYRLRFICSYIEPSLFGTHVWYHYIIHMWIGILLTFTHMHMFISLCSASWNKSPWWHWVRSNILSSLSTQKLTWLVAAVQYHHIPPRSNQYTEIWNE